LIRKYWFTCLLILALAAGVAAWYLWPGFSYGALVAAERLRSGVYRAVTTVDEAPVAYLEGGDGEVVLLLHGFSANKDHWTRVARFLTPHVRVVAPDLPGFGESGLVDGGDYSVEAQAERLRRFAADQGLTRFHLGGSSTGGNIAGVLAARYPEMVESLWLIAPLGVSGADPSEVERLVASGEPPPLIIERPQQYGRVLDLVFEKQPWIPRPVERYLARQAAARYQHYRWVYRQIRDVGPGECRPATPLEPLLAGSAVPTLIVWGDRDRVLDVSGAAVLAAVMADARIEIMPGVGHLPMLESPEETAARYLEFIGVPAADGS
jgi:pimeloyl-ACP methyl ester carboxylesterase